MAAEVGAIRIEFDSLDQLSVPEAEELLVEFAEHGADGEVTSTSRTTGAMPGPEMVESIAVSVMYASVAVGTAAKVLSIVTTRFRRAVLVEFLGGYANHADSLGQHLGRLRTVDRSDRQFARLWVARSTRLSESDEHEIVNRYEAGESTNAIASSSGLHRGTVSAVLKRRGVPTRYSFMTGELLVSALRLRSQGLSFRAIGEELGVARSTVQSALRRVSRPD